jgi:hypothetical protein
MAGSLYAHLSRREGGGMGVLLRFGVYPSLCKGFEGQMWTLSIVKSIVCAQIHWSQKVSYRLIFVNQLVNIPENRTNYCQWCR